MNVIIFESAHHGQVIKLFDKHESHRRIEEFKRALRNYNIPYTHMFAVDDIFGTNDNTVTYETFSPQQEITNANI